MLSKLELFQQQNILVSCYPIPVSMFRDILNPCSPLWPPGFTIARWWTKMAEGHVQPRPCRTVGAASGTGTATETDVCASTPVCPVTLSPPLFHSHITFMCLRCCVVAAFGSILKYYPLVSSLYLSPSLWNWTSNLSWYLRNVHVLWNPLMDHVHFLTFCFTKLILSVPAHLLCHFPPCLRVKPHSLVTSLWPETAFCHALWMQQDTETVAF
jgi:hypothetical protein